MPETVANELRLLLWFPTYIMNRIVLIVEDNDDERRIFSAAFYFNGFEVLEAGTGIDAVNSARERRPDLIVCDIRLPDMNGFLAAELIRSNPGYEKIPVICVTGMDVPAYIANNKGCDLLLRKPVSPHELINAANRLSGPMLSA